MLARAVDAREGLLVQQADQTVLFGGFLHDLHGQLVVVVGDVGGGEDRRQLVLRGSDLVVLCLCEHAELPQLLVKLLHICRNAGLDRAEIVVVKLLSLGRLRAEKGSARELQILALIVQLLIDQEVLLLGADGGNDARHLVLAEKVENLDRLGADALHRTEQRGFFIEHLARIGTKRGGNVKRAVAHKRGRSGIPCGVASRLKGRADAARGERGRVGLALDQLLARELHDHAVAVGLDKAVVLLRGNARHRLEPVGIVSAAHFDRPILHRRRYDVRDADIKRLAVLNGLFERLIGGFRQSFLHFLVVKYHTSEHLGYFRHKKTLLTEFFVNPKQALREIPAAPLPFIIDSIFLFRGFVKAFCVLQLNSVNDRIEPENNKGKFYE